MKTRIFSARLARPALSALCVVSIGTFAVAAQAQVPTSKPAVSTSYASRSLQNSAEALLRFAALNNVALERGTVHLALQPFVRPLLLPRATQVQSAALSLKLPLVSVPSLAQIREHGGPALVRLQAPDEWIVLGGAGSGRSVLQSASGAQIVENSALSSRFVEALVLSRSDATTSRVFVSEPVQTVRVTTVGEPSRVRVPVLNRGAVPLQLQVLHTSCSCTSDDSSVRTLAPGQSGELGFKIEAREEGTRTVSVLIGTSDPSAPRLPLIFEIHTPYIPTPPTVFLSGNKGQSIRSTFDLTLPEGATILGISSTRNFISTQLVPSADKAVQRVQITVADNAPAGQFSDALQVVLSGSDIAKIVVPLDGYINNDISVSPRMVSLGNVAPGEIVRRTVLLQAPDDQPFAVQSIKAEKPLLSAKTDFAVVGTSHVIEIEAAANGANDSLQNRLTLLLSDDRELDIDVMGIVSSGSSPANAKLQIGQPAPDFSVVDANGQLQKLSDRRGRRNVLLTFFPRCFTGGCTAQNLSLRDEYLNFVRLNTDVLAVSVDAADGENGQRAFTAKYKLPFPLLPDTSRALSVLYGAAQSSSDATSLRQSVLIDKDGIVRWVDRDVQTATHGADVLRAMRELGMN